MWALAVEGRQSTNVMPTMPRVGVAPGWVDDSRLSEQVFDLGLFGEEASTLQ